MEQQNMTAVEWLVYELERCGYFEINDHFPITFEQAKQKEQDIISESWNDGNLIGRNGWILEEYSTGKEYYKKKYKDK